MEIGIVRSIDLDGFEIQIRHNLRDDSHSATTDDQYIDWREIHIIYRHKEVFSHIWNNVRAHLGAASDAVLYIADNDVIFVRAEVVSIRNRALAPAQNYESLHCYQALVGRLTCK